MPPSAPLTLTLLRLVPASARSVLLTLSTGDDFAFVPGQAVRLGTPGAARKPYSIASSPADARERRVLEFLVGIEPGRPLPFLRGLSPGAPVVVEGPVGSFVLPEPVQASRVLLLAGGTGIAPLRSMWRHLLSQESTARVSVAYGVRTPDDVAFADELDDLAARNRIDLLVTCSRGSSGVASYRSGRIDLATTQSLVGGNDALACVCGPPSFVADVVAMLGQSGLPDARILRESW